MNALAALLYRRDLAWQSPRVAARKAVQAQDVEDNDADAVTRAVKRHWGAVATVLGVVVPVLLAYGDIKKDLAVLSTEVQNLKTSKAGAATLRPSASPSASAQPSAVPMASASPVPDPSAAPQPSGTSRGLKGFPSNAPATSPPECVSSKVFKKMACEQALKDSCHGLSGFTPERYRDIRKMAGVGEYMLVCDEK